MALSALARQQNYTEIEKLLTPKKMFTSQKLVCPFPWPAFFAQIARYGSPQVEVVLCFNYSMLICVFRCLHVG